ncbi:hypothetical protein NL676_015550 [Syzygium grande]|nr:hypothetical protein NL676_015550 [Syzygium grande]
MKDEVKHLSSGLGLVSDVNLQKRQLKEWWDSVFALTGHEDLSSLIFSPPQKSSAIVLAKLTPQEIAQELPLNFQLSGWPSLSAVRNFS